MNYSFDYWIKKLNLSSHVEGGAFREIYRAEVILPKQALTPVHKGDRNAMTSIYYLLRHGDFSAFHRIASDELWHFYDGAPLHIYEINRQEQLLHHVLGKSDSEECELFVAIKAGSWFASRVEEKDGYALCGCTVGPGFDFGDFELGDRSSLKNSYPAYTGIIDELTR